MRYYIMPIEDARAVFAGHEISHMRRSVDGSQVIAHEEVLLRRPVYEHGSAELAELLSSPQWSEEKGGADNGV